MAYAHSRRPGAFRDLDVPPSSRILARTTGPYSYDPQLEGFFDVIAAPFKFGAKAVGAVGKGAYQVGKFAVKRVPAAAAGFAAGGPVGAAIGVGTSIARDLARRGAGQPGAGGAYPTEYPTAIGYGPGTYPAYTSGAQGYGWSATTPLFQPRVAPRPALPPAAVAPALTTDTLLKFAPLALGALLLLRK